MSGKNKKWHQPRIKLNLSYFPTRQVLLLVLGESVYGRQAPHRNLITTWIKKFAENGTVSNYKSCGHPCVSQQMVETVRAVFIKSIRRASLELVVLTATLQNCERHLGPTNFKFIIICWRMISVCAYRLNDSINMIEADPNFYCNVLFSDNTTFHVCEKVNHHNCWIWGE